MFNHLLQVCTQIVKLIFFVVLFVYLHDMAAFNIDITSVCFVGAKQTLFALTTPNENKTASKSNRQAGLVIPLLFILHFKKRNQHCSKIY